MNLILAIHPDVEDAPGSLDVVKDSFRQDPKTLVIYFPMVSESNSDPQLKRLKMVGNPDNFMSLKNFSGSFGDYQDDFLEILRRIRTNLKPNEKIRVISFGGYAEGCYERIAPRAHYAIKQVFGKSVSSIETDLRGMYGRPEPKRPVQKPKKTTRRNPLR